MTSFIPITHIQSVFKAREAHIRAVILSLPSEPVNVKTPELLARVTGKEWSETIISHDLFQIWLAVLFIIKSSGVLGEVQHRGGALKCQKLENDFTMNLK